MRSLFFKIFIWFWLSYILIGAVSLALFFTTHDQMPPSEGTWSGTSRAALSFYAEQAAVIYERKGRAGLAPYLQQLSQLSRLQAYLFDTQGHELTQRPVPPEIEALARSARQGGQHEFAIAHNNPYRARLIITSQGHTYIFVGDTQREPGTGSGPGEPPDEPGSPLIGPSTPPPHPSGPWAILMPRDMQFHKILAFMCVASLVCYGLTHYLTAPTLKLREATRQLARGELSTRVADKMGRRRDELADLGRDFDQMAERIETVMLAERRLLADISHELRSPLARMQVALDLASQTADGETQDFLNRMEREIRRLDDLIGQLLILNRLESQGITSQSTTTQEALVNLLRLTQEVVADADFEARNHNRGVELIAAEDCWVLGSEEMLRRALENVIRNAIRYTADGTKIEVTAECWQVGSDGQAIISVRDHGPGVPEASLEDIFRPFYRVADARDRQSGGVGLGLSITERAIRLHGGNVTANNAPGGGLMITLSVPSLETDR